MIRLWIVIISLLWVSGISAAHEVRPGYLKLTETETHQFDVRWKQPVNAGRRLKLDPVFPDGCERNKSDMTFGSGTITESFVLNCDLKSGTLAIAGLERTLTDVFVEIEYENGEFRRELLKPDIPAFDFASASGAKTSAYLGIGVEHILLGWDHLLFVIGLVLLVDRRQIIGVASAFTIAHSLTLALAAFGFLNLPSRPVEILIAASIVLLAIEIIRKYRGEIGLSARKPYLVGFMIGLIHGCGFASALSDIGLPKGTELLALLMFNLGVEFGQFLVVALCVAFLVLMTKMNLNRNRITETLASYAIGTIAMFWVIDRVKDYIV